MRICLDTCIIIDAFLNRRPFAASALEIFIRAAKENVDAFVTSNTVTDIYYILSRHMDESLVRKYLSDFLKLFGVLDVNQEDIRRALDSDIKDFEDAVLCMSAKRNEMDMIITRNTRGFTNSPIRVMTPDDYVKQIYPI